MSPDLEPCRIDDKGVSPAWRISEADRNVRLAQAKCDPVAVAKAKRAYAMLLTDLLLEAGAERYCDTGKCVHTPKPARTKRELWTHQFKWTVFRVMLWAWVFVFTFFG